LTAWFKLNQVDESAGDIFYSDIPLHYTYLKEKGQWKKREKFYKPTLSRM